MQPKNVLLRKRKHELRSMRPHAWIGLSKKEQKRTLSTPPSSLTLSFSRSLAYSLCSSIPVCRQLRFAIRENPMILSVVRPASGRRFNFGQRKGPQLRCLYLSRSVHIYMYTERSDTRSSLNARGHLYDARVVHHSTLVPRRPFHVSSHHSLHPWTLAHVYICGVHVATHNKSATFLYLASRPRPRMCILSALCFVRDPYNSVVFGGFKYADLNQ